MIRRFVPVYLITGFIESGKTTLGLTVLGNERFTNGGPVLVICCEDGEVEWDEAALKKNNGILVMLDSSEELTSQRLADLEAAHKPSCVIMEYNSMWGLEKLDTLVLPRLWDWAQVVTTADATTFENYMTNMRKQITDPMKPADLILINRCAPSFDKSKWRKQLRALNPSATILFENPDGSTEDGVSDEDLPYDVKADVIDISEDNFGIFYLDAMEHTDRYDGKVVELVGQPFPDETFPKGFYLFGRYAMTCCANDIAKCGWVCKGSQAPSDRGFIRLKAKCQVMHAPDGQPAIMLHEIEASKAPAPKDKYVTFGTV
jgi:hypothetical protein